MANGAIINKKKKSQTAATFLSLTYRVKILPGPFSSIDLILKLLCHNSLCVLVIQMCQVHYSKRQNKIIKKNMHYATKPPVKEFLMRFTDLAIPMTTLTQSFSHVLVQIDSICVLHKLSDNFTLVIFNHQHLQSQR